MIYVEGFFPAINRSIQTSKYNFCKLFNIGAKTIYIMSLGKPFEKDILYPYAEISEFRYLCKKKFLEIYKRQQEKGIPSFIKEMAKLPKKT